MATEGRHNRTPPAPVLVQQVVLAKMGFPGAVRSLGERRVPVPVAPLMTTTMIVASAVLVLFCIMRAIRAVAINVNVTTTVAATTTFFFCFFLFFFAA